MIQRVRGTRDILPPESALWSAVEETARRVFAGFGYDEIRIPIMESTELFVRTVGEGTDIVSKEMYTFPDRKGRSLTLRPEGTASVARAFIENGLGQRPQPLRLSYLGPMFRYERPQKGRYRQFHQVGVEAIGSASPVQMGGAGMDSTMARKVTNDAAAYIASLARQRGRDEADAMAGAYWGEQAQPPVRFDDPEGMPPRKA